MRAVVSTLVKPLLGLWPVDCGLLGMLAPHWVCAQQPEWVVKLGCMQLPLCHFPLITSASDYLPDGSLIVGCRVEACPALAAAWWRAWLRLV